MPIYVIFDTNAVLSKLEIVTQKVNFLSHNGESSAMEYCNETTRSMSKQTNPLQGRFLIQADIRD
jgi:hypothetical protein